ncbi:extracellular solute-binding protein [Alicyclobacillus mengziensis]|uniref:Extracellular solute-binding protein n=1 Tax=Alicyclobacillus mengziensis TaxID=2931921 RepID=A0A9X7Z676_9BACL|nr:extracellular solute-binding protein [Alicyclobacillus mengziensis]QSO46051.1 extracellular solute-binding protein [Alicyclobacillus mengziensis]
MQRRTLIITASTLTMVTLLAGCGASQSGGGTTASQSTNTASTSPNTSSKSMVDINFWAGHSSGTLYKALVAETAAFNKEHPNIHVTFTAEGATKKGMAAFLAHKSPNVGMISTYAAQTFANAGAILNLTPYITGKNGLSQQQIQNDYFPVIWKDMQGTGTNQYIMPLEKKSGVVIYYNADMFKKAGISSAPKTWNDVWNDAKKITALGGKAHGIAWTPMIQQFFVMTMDNGGQVFTDSSESKFNLVNTGAESTLQTLRNLVKNGDIIVGKGYQYQQDFGTGDIGLLMDASAGYTYDKGSVGGKFPFDAASAPIGSSGKAYNWINGASVAMFNTGTQAQKDASWEFVKYLSGPANNTYWNEHTNYLPLGPAGKTQMQSFYQSKPGWAASYSNPQDWIMKPTNTNWSAAKTAMDTDFMKALNGQESVTQALKNMNAEGNKYLSGQGRL